MFRLIKLAAYGLFGLALYEFIRGMSESSSRGGGSKGTGGMRPQGGDESQSAQAKPRQSKPRGGRRAAPNAGSIPAGGMRVETQDADGASMTETVGRGVIRRP